MATQQDVKTVLGKYYDEDANYDIRVLIDASGILFDFDELECDEEYGEGGARFTSRLEINADIFFAESYSTSELYQPLDKIKKLSMYKELVDEYGFDDDEYLNGSTYNEALEDYISDVRVNNDQYLDIILQEDMQLDENALKELEEDGETRIYTFDAKILKIEPKNIPSIIEELDVVDDMLTQAKAEYEELFKIRIADERLAIHDVTIEKDQ